MNRTLKIKKESIASILVMLFVVTFILDQKSQAWGEINWIIGIMGLLSLIDFEMKDFKVILIIIAMLFSGFLSIVYTKNSDLYSVVVGLKYIGISILLYKHKVNFKYTRTLFYSVSLFFFYYMFNGIDPSDIFLSSRNMLSVIMIFCTSLIFISNDVANLSPYYVIINSIICIWAAGRSGIVASFIILLGFLWIHYSKHRRKILKTVFLVIIVISSINFLVPEVRDSVVSNYNSSINYFKLKGFESDERNLLRQQYVEEIKENPVSLFLGVNKKKNAYFSLFGYNLHNSYLDLHSNYGLLGVLIIFVGLIVVFRNLYRSKDYFKILLLTSLLLRIYTDTIAFRGIFEVLIYYFIFYFSNTTNQRKFV